MKRKSIAGLMMSNKQPQIVYFTEHQQPESHDSQVLEQLTQDIDNPIVFSGNPDMKKTPAYLGINKDFTASYYIGTCWLQEGEIAAAVMPKMELDYFEMLRTALAVDTEYELQYFQNATVSILTNLRYR